MICNNCEQNIADIMLDEVNLMQETMQKVERDHKDNEIIEHVKKKHINDKANIERFMTHVLYRLNEINTN